MFCLGGLRGGVLGLCLSIVAEGELPNINVIFDLKVGRYK